MFVRTRGYLLYVRGDGRPVFFFVVLFCRPVQLPLKLEDGARRIWGEGDRAGELDNRRAREPESRRAGGPESRRKKQDGHEDDQYPTYMDGGIVAGFAVHWVPCS